MSWKFKFFWDDAKNAKNDANVLKMYFLDFQCFFTIFWIFLKIYQNMGQKLGSNNEVPCEKFGTYSHLSSAQVMRR
jgi:hypothetical protein